MFYNAHIRSHIDYSSTLWDGCGNIHLKRIDSLQRRAAKLILPDPSLTTDQKINKLGILPLHDHLRYNKGVMMYKILNDKLPKHLKSMFTKSLIINNDITIKNRLILPMPKLDIYKTSLCFSGSLLWNSLPINIKSNTSLSSFKENLFKYLVMSATVT